MKLLKLEITGLNIFDNKTPIVIDFINDKRVNESEVEDGLVYKLANKLYQLNTLALVGINASGKTTMLKIISNISPISLKSMCSTTLLLQIWHCLNISIKHFQSLFICKMKNTFIVLILYSISNLTESYSQTKKSTKNPSIQKQPEINCYILMTACRLMSVPKPITLI